MLYRGLRVWCPDSVMVSNVFINIMWPIAHDFNIIFIANLQPYSVMGRRGDGSSLINVLNTELLYDTTNQ